MCRIAIFNKEGFDKFDNGFGVLKELDHLVQQCGGHSQGYMLIKDNMIIKSDKGTKLSNKDIYIDTVNTDFDYFIYHTRIASVGDITDANAHPFINNDKTFGIIMNGTERGIISSLADDVGITDTEFVFRMFDKMNLPTDMLTEFDSRYIGFRDGQVFIKNTKFNSLEFINYKKGGMVVASNFPFYDDVKTMNEGMWFEGQTLIGTKKEKPVAVSYSKYKPTNKAINWDDDRSWNSSFRQTSTFDDYEWVEDDYERLQYGYGYEDEDWFKKWKEKRKAVEECR